MLVDGKNINSIEMKKDAETGVEKLSDCLVSRSQKQRLFLSVASVLFHLPPSNLFLALYKLSTWQKQTGARSKNILLWV